MLPYRPSAPVPPCNPRYHLDSEQDHHLQGDEVTPEGKFAHVLRALKWMAVGAFTMYTALTCWWAYIVWSVQ